jgi:peptidoglycan/LPS O-acetylase OafA/YrhL
MLPQVGGRQSLNRPRESRGDDADGLEFRRLTRVGGLDGLRGLAILAVITFHARGFFATHRRPVHLAQGGFLGVDLFFVLSGFLITALLLGEQATHGRFSFSHFYRRRALRILPALVVFVIVYVVYGVVAGFRADVIESSAVQMLLFVTNLRPPLSNLPLGDGLVHMWSLAVEEQFYLVWPLLVATVITVHRRTWVVVSAMLAMIGAIAIYRAASYDDVFSAVRLSIWTPSRADSLLVGCLLAYLWVTRKLPSRLSGAPAWIALGALAGLMLFCSLINPLLYLGGFTLVAVLCALIVLEVVTPGTRMARMFDQPALRVVGKVSFGLYIWHVVVFGAVDRWGGGLPPTLQLSVALAATVAVTSLSWLLIEAPALRWKAKLERNSADAPALPRAPLPAPAALEG